MEDLIENEMNFHIWIVRINRKMNRAKQSVAKKFLQKKKKPKIQNIPENFNIVFEYYYL